MNDLSRYGPWALIAGGSEGIGLSFASELAAQGISLILVARRLAPLESARTQLLADYPNIEVAIQAIDLVASDLSNQINDIIAGKDIGLLIYNAGATNNIDLFVDESLENIQRLISLNCSGPAVLCHTLGSAMVARGSGGIIIVGSMSGLAGSAYNATYSAAKAFEMVLAEGLFVELKPRGIDVICLIAGKTDTPSLGRLGESLGVLNDSDSMTADDVAREGLMNITNGPVHIAGEENRVGAEFLSADRRQATQLLSSATAQMYSRPYPFEPD
ncbi:MAG: SDR family NAD(P)-dependent oxidoreductase [Halioglobus sp.]